MGRRGAVPFPYPYGIRGAMQFLLTLAIVATLVIAEYAPRGPVSGVVAQLVLTAAALLIVPAVAALAAGLSATPLPLASVSSAASLPKMRRSA